MKTSSILCWFAGCALVAAPMMAARAGDETALAARSAAAAPTQTGPAAAVTQMGAYLQAQKLNHTIDVVDAKAVSAAQGPLTVKINADLDAAQQDAVCAALKGIAKSTRMEGSAVQFYAPERSGGNNGGGASGYQASTLPSGNGSVSFNREKPSGAATGYKLKRTVRL